MSEERTEKETVERMYYTLNDVQEITGLSRSTVYALLKKEGFPKTRILKNWLIPKEEFHKWLSERTTKAKIE